MAEEHVTTGCEENKPQAPPAEIITPICMEIEQVQDPHPMKKSKWVDWDGDRGTINNWSEYAKEQGWISQDFRFGRKVKKYLPKVFLGDLGNYPNAEAFYTDDLPLKEGDLVQAILIDKLGSGHCFVRNIRIEGDQVFVMSPL